VCTRIQEKRRGFGEWKKGKSLLLDSLNFRRIEPAHLGRVLTPSNCCLVSLLLWILLRRFSSAISPPHILLWPRRAQHKHTRTNDSLGPKLGRANASAKVTPKAALHFHHFHRSPIGILFSRGRPLAQKAQKARPMRRKWSGAAALRSTEAGRPPTGCFCNCEGYLSASRLASGRSSAAHSLQWGQSVVAFIWRANCAHCWNLQFELPDFPPKLEHFPLGFQTLLNAGT